MAILKQGMLDCPDNDGEMLSHSNSRLSASRSLWGVDRDYLC